MFVPQHLGCFHVFTAVNNATLNIGCVHVQLCLTLYLTPWTLACQAPLVHEDFFRQEYWSGLVFPPPAMNTGVHISFWIMVLSTTGF